MDSQAELFQAMSSLLSTGKYSDLSIICQDRRYPVHKVMLCPRSHFFDGACSSGFLEASNGAIDLSEEDPEAVEQMIHWFYNLDYLTEASAHTNSSPLSTWRQPVQRRTKKLDLTGIEDPLMAMAMSSSACAPQNPTPPASPRLTRSALGKRTPSPEAPRGHRRTRSRKHSDLAPPRGFFAMETMRQEQYEDEEADCGTPDLILHARIYALAEKYGIPMLKALAKRKFEILSQERWQDEDLAEAIEEVYGGTIEEDRGLRDVVVHLLRTHEDLARREDVREAVENIPLLAWDLHRIQNGIPIHV